MHTHDLEYDSTARTVASHTVTPFTVATLSAELHQDDADELGRVFAVAPDLLRRLEDIVTVLDTAPSGVMLEEIRELIDITRPLLIKANPRGAEVILRSRRDEH